MGEREKYINMRLMELDLTAEERPLEPIEQQEELALMEELKGLNKEILY